MQMKDIYNEKLTMLKKQLKKTSENGKKSSYVCRLAGLILQKRSSYPKHFIDPMQFPPFLTQVFIEIEKLILNFIWKLSKPWIAKTIPNNKRTPRGITTPDFKSYYRYSNKSSIV